MTNMIYTAMPALPKKHHTNAVALPSEWNTCPLSSIVEEISETVGTRKIETISISAGIGFVNQAEKFGRELSGKQYEKYIVLHKGDFSYNKGNSNIYPQGCIYRLNNRTEAAVPNVFESFRVSVGNPDYYEQLFLSGFLNRQLYSKINRGVRNNGLLNLKGKDFYSCEVPYPPLAEQERIAEILIQCDRVIELKEQKLDELKQLKKEFLRKMFPAKGCDTPEIRFPGFTGAWKQRKLGELSCSFEYGLNAAAKEYDGQNKYLRITDIDDTSRQFVTTDITSPDTNLTDADSYKLSDGDVLFARTGASVGKTYLYKKFDGLVYFAGFLIRAKIKESVNAGFIFQNTLTRDYERYIAITSQRSGQPGVNAQEYAEYQLMLPELFEQNKIAKLLEALDTLITLHQRELEETKTYKKTLAKLLLTGIVRVQG